MGTCRRPRNHLTDMASQAAVPRAASAGPSRERREISLPDDWPGAFDAAWSFGPLLEDAARDDEALYLACALVDLRDPRVAVVPLDRMILHVPVAAQSLNRVVGDLVRCLRGVELRAGACLGDM